jgi:hypothetical protein
MLIEHLLKIKLNPDKVVQYQNAAVMLISLYTLYILYNPVRFGYYDNFTNTFLTVFAAIDIFFVDKTDMFIHHICLLVFVFFRNYFTVYGYYGTILTTQLLKTELSTIFYVLEFWIPKKFLALRTVSGLAFLATFFKFRVYDMFHYIAVNRDLYIYIDSVVKHQYLLGYITSWGAFYTLYGLNLYWFTVIMKKMYKALCIKYDSHANAEYILQHTYEGCLLACIYVYLFESQIKYAYLFYIFGAAVLTICSGIYHASNYYMIQTEGEDFNRLQYPNIFYYYLDNVSIHIRFFLMVLTNTLVKSLRGSMSIYCVALGLLSSYSIISGILIYLIKSRVNYTYMFSNPASHKYSAVIRALLFLSGSLCLIAVNKSTDDLKLKGYSLVVMYLLVLVGIIRPFYKMNHVLIHALHIFHTWTVCKINAS